MHDVATHPEKQIFHNTWLVWQLLYSPNRACDDGVLVVLLRGTKGNHGASTFILIRKNRYLVTPAVVSPTRNGRSRAQTSIFTIENRFFWSIWRLRPVGHRTASAESLEATCGPQTIPGVDPKQLQSAIRWTLDLNIWTLDLNRWTLDLHRWILELNRWTLNSINRKTLDLNRWLLGFTC